MSRITITVTVEADESVVPLKLNDLRESIARTISEDYGTWNDQHGYESVSALVNKIRVDGLQWDKETSRLVQVGPVTPEVERLLMNGQRISAIKELRIQAGEAGEYLGLADAKAIVDEWEARR